MKDQPSVVCDHCNSRAMSGPIALVVFVFIILIILHKGQMDEKAYKHDMAIKMLKLDYDQRGERIDELREKLGTWQVLETTEVIDGTGRP